MTQELLSTQPTSRRQYLSQSELQQFADITISNPTEADVLISQAEEILDGYVGFQDQFLSKREDQTIIGKAQAANANTLTLESRHSNVFLVNYFSYTELEIIGGTGQGQRNGILSSTYPNTIVTFVNPFTTAPDATSLYRIYQLGKFPRRKDCYLDAINPPTPIYYKSIPESIKRATAAQIEYMLNQGYSFFKSDDIFKSSEKIGDYTWDKPRDGSGTGITQMIAPKAKMFLQGYINRKGIMLV